MKTEKNIFMEKTPENIQVAEIKRHLSGIEGVEDVHHIHIWTMDGISHFATLHLVTDADSKAIKEKVREELREHHIGHVTIEIESSAELCEDPCCHVEMNVSEGHHHHHH